MTKMKHPSKNQVAVLAAVTFIVTSFVLGISLKNSPQETPPGNDADEVQPAHTNSCQTGQDLANCTAQSLAELAKQDPKRALDEYDAMMGNDPIALQQCHGAHHILGEAAGKVLELDVLIKTNPGTCGLGFIHGAIAAYLGRLPVNEVSAKGPNVCNTIKSQSSDESLYNNCQHALGHRIALNGVEFQDMTKVCSNENQMGYDSCLSGGYMELFSKDSSNDDLDTFADSCNSNEGIPARACWVALMARTSGTISSIDPAQMGGLCISASAPETCARGAGEAYGLISIDRKDEIISSLVEACRPMGPYEEFCLIGGVVIIYGAAIQGVISLKNVESGLKIDIPQAYQESIARSLKETTFTPPDPSQ